MEINFIEILKAIRNKYNLSCDYDNLIIEDFSNGDIKIFNNLKEFAIFCLTTEKNKIHGESIEELCNVTIDKTMINKNLAEIIISNLYNDIIIDIENNIYVFIYPNADFLKEVHDE